MFVYYLYGIPPYTRDTAQCDIIHTEENQRATGVRGTKRLKQLKANRPTIQPNTLFCSNPSTISNIGDYDDDDDDDDDADGMSCVCMCVCVYIDLYVCVVYI